MNGTVWARPSRPTQPGVGSRFLIGYAPGTDAVDVSQQPGPQYCAVKTARSSPDPVYTAPQG